MKRFFTNLGIIQIFSSLLLVIGIMFASNYFVYQRSISDIYERVAQNNTLATKNMIQSFDNSFRSVNNVIHNIHGLPYSSLESEEEDGRIDMLKVYTMQESISTLVSSIDFIEEVVVFYDDLDLAITSTGTSSLTHLFQNKYKHDLYNESYWRTYAKGKNSFKVLPGQYFKSSANTTTQQRKKLMIAVGGNKVRMSNKNILVLIDEAALLKHVNQELMIPGASLIVLDQERRVILSTDASSDLSSILDEVYFSPSQEATLTKKDYQYNFYKSDFNGFIYIDKVPYQFQNIDSVTEANNLIMLSTIIGAVLLSVLLSIYLNRPVKKIIRQLGGSSRGNDFRKILSGIIKMQMDAESSRQQLEQAEAEARRGLFLQVIDDYAGTEEQDPEQYNYCSNLLRSKSFVLLVIQLKEKGKKSAPLPVEDLLKTLHSALLHDNSDLQVFYEHNLQFIALVGLNHMDERTTLLKGLKSVFAGLEKDHLSDYFIQSSVSKLYAAGLANYRLAYRNAVSGLLYRAANETSSVLDAETINYEWNLYFPFDKIEKLSNHMANGKLPEAITVITETINENANRQVHFHQLRHIAKTIFLYMLQHAQLAPHVSREMYKLEQEFMQRIDHAHKDADIAEALVEAARHISEHAKRQEINKLNPGFISQYIELHYMENLYLDHIAEVAGTSPKYFSSYFKKTFGINYVEYLNKVRLSHAKELLKDSFLSISEIGEKTGYMNSSTFTTTFKKYVGISPSEYRKQFLK